VKVSTAWILFKIIDEVDTSTVNCPLRKLQISICRAVNIKGVFYLASNRINRINEEIQKELSSLIRTLKDPRIQDTMISITRVETTPDLRYTKVYVSFLQEEKAADAMKGLKSAAGYLRRELGSALNLRYTPQIMWALDDSITYGTKLLALINSLGVEQDGEE
jgi:ribosome-binding factor A